ncbi:MAG: heme exporter protein CcmB [Flavobacteriales bacterium]|nr:heme exporter protein CcmB [Flavobacteriales bacterium]
MFNSKEISALLQKEFTLEFRQKHALAGIILYVLSTVFVCYLSLQEIDKVQTWSALVWIISIFTVFNALAKSFQHEAHGVQLYLYTLASPLSVILSKIIYNSLLVAVLNTIALLLFILFLGNEVLADADMFQFTVGLILGSTGLGAMVTFISGIAYKAGNNVGLMAILGFPVIIPLLLTLTRFSEIALEGLPFSVNGLNLLILGVLNASSIILAAILFPYLWRD